VASQLDIFIAPVLDRFLVYAPRHEFSALVGKQAAQQIRAGLLDESASATLALQPFLEILRRPGAALPQPRTGPFANPFFLGLIPTRACNMSCPYCDFAASGASGKMMDLKLAREAVNVYMEVLVANNHRHAEVHFFGGEPFCAEELVHFVVGYAGMRAAELGLTVRFEATSNGLYNVARAHWIADYFDTIVLSLDGPADIQDRNRPAVNGRSVFEAVTRTGRIFSERCVELTVRTCVTNDTVPRMPEIASWVARHFRPSTLCFETLTDSPLNEAVGLGLPDPWDFARQFDIAARLLDAYGIETINSTADIRTRQLTFCPVGRDAMIVSPDGAVDACYLLKKDWSRNGLNMRYGKLNVPGVTQPAPPSITLDQIGFAGDLPSQPALQIDDEALQRIRELNVLKRPLCTHCMCRYNCAGGCHVNHDTSAESGNFDRLCIQTRLITIANLLKILGQHDLVTEWFADRAAVERSAWQANDRITSHVVLVGGA
jgi:uncharacterized protein